jgi:hypothetical protein
VFTTNEAHSSSHAQRRGLNSPSERPRSDPNFRDKTVKIPSFKRGSNIFLQTCGLRMRTRSSGFIETLRGRRPSGGSYKMAGELKNRAWHRPL